MSENMNLKTIRNTNLNAGDDVTVLAFNPNNGAELEISGSVVTAYTDEKVAIQTDGQPPGGKTYIVNEETKSVRVGSFADGFEVVDSFRPVGVRAAEAEEDTDGDEDSVELVFEHRTHGAHEKTGKEWTRVSTERRSGEVLSEDPIRFKVAGYEGVYAVREGGRVVYERAEGHLNPYEVGTEGRLERPD